MNKNHYALIMAGGIGSRFWPVSTSELPKQFHDMLGTGQSLIQKTFTRLQQIVPTENIRILTNEDYLELTQKQLPEIDRSQIILEPAMRNTAACIAMASIKIQKENPEAVMLVAPSDHWIEDETAFSNDIRVCFEACSTSDKLITLGINPTFPNTGYGYIESKHNPDSDLQKVIQFREKPDYETAKKFLEAGNFDWNAGIFIWSVESITSAFKKHLPKMHELFYAGMPYYNTEEETAFVKENYPLAENISIDYGILEKADNVYVLPANFDWNDLGTWGSLHKQLNKDSDNNAIVRAETLLENSNNNIIYTESKKLVVLDGLKDYIVVDKEDVLLIYPIDKEQEIKEVLAKVNEKFPEKNF